VSSASSKIGDLAKSGVHRVRAQTLGIPSREIARSDIPTAGGSGGHSRIGKWNTGGTKPRNLAARSLEVLVFGFTRREVARAFKPGPTMVSGEFKAIGSRRTHGVRLGYSPPRPSQL
jgi:hypothetical protein